MDAIVYRTPKGNPATDTKKVAAAFGKAHKTVLRACDNLEISEEFSRHNFAPIKMTSSRGRGERVIVMTKTGFVRLVMSFTGKKAAAFKEQYIAQFDAMEQELHGLRVRQPEVNVLAHTKREVQIANSKSINHHQFLIGGVNSVVAYNRQNCLLHTGKRPNVIKREAKAIGMPSKFRTSAKEVLRHVQPESACSMSLADELVRRGATLEQAAAVSIQAKQVFAGLLRLGFTPTQLSQ